MTTFTLERTFSPEVTASGSLLFHAFIVPEHDTLETKEVVEFTCLGHFIVLKSPAHLATFVSLGYFEEVPDLPVMGFKKSMKIVDTILEKKPRSHE